MDNWSNGGWVGFDLDGTLAQYDGYIDHMTIGAPIPRTVARIKAFIDHGQEVRIFTARANPGTSEHRKREAEEAKDAIITWCEKHIGVPLKVTYMKDYEMRLLIDDRCEQVEANTGRLVTDQAYQRGFEDGLNANGTRP